MTTSDDARAGNAPPRLKFGDVARIRYQLDEARRRGTDDQAALGDEYEAALTRFEDAHGEIVNAYWCTKAEGAIALTAGRPLSGWQDRLVSPAPQLHHHTDWASRDAPDIARALDRCYEMALRATEVLRGGARRIMIALSMRSACRLMMLLDSSHGQHETDRSDALAEEQRAIAQLDGDYREFVDGDQKLVYVCGIAVSIAALALLFLSAGSIAVTESTSSAGLREDVEAIVASLIAGAVGGAVSVLARLNSGTLNLNFEFPFSRGWTLFLGALRPFVGSIFGVLAFFMLTSGFVEIFAVPDRGTNERFYFLTVIAFAAGFTERWAQDTLTGGLGTGTSHSDPASATRRSRSRPRSPAEVDAQSQRSDGRDRTR